jgi:hypothetical protein
MEQPCQAPLPLRAWQGKQKLSVIFSIFHIYEQIQYNPAEAPK